MLSELFGRGNRTTRPIPSFEVLTGVFWLTDKKTSFEEIGKNEHAPYLILPYLRGGQALTPAQR